MREAGPPTRHDPERVTCPYPGCGWSGNEETFWKTHKPQHLDEPEEGFDPEPPETIVVQGDYPGATCAEGSDGLWYCTVPGCDFDGYMDAMEQHAGDEHGTAMFRKADR
jgi:hypothetical protein